MINQLSKASSETNVYKRVFCLYRVSNPNQVDNDDIPMQKKACHLFASAHFGWVIKKEFYEKGISGYSVSEDDRDSIIQLREAAINKEFDVLNNL